MSGSMQRPGECPPAQGSSALRRSLTALDLAALGVGAIFGTGVFVVTGRAAALHAGPAVALSFVLAGLAASLAALCYAELSCMMSVAGSAYAYTYQAFGRFVAFCIGWDLILEYLVSAALVAVAWSGYLAALVQRALGITIPAALAAGPLAFDGPTRSLTLSGGICNAPAVVLCLAMTGLLAGGIKQSARFSAVAAAAKMIAVGLFIAFAMPFVRRANLTPFLPPNDGAFGHFGPSGLFRGTTIVYLSYIGFDAVSTAAQEAKNPQRDLPIGVLLPLFVCTVVYVAVAITLTGVVHYTELTAANPLAAAAAAMGLPWLEVVVGAAAVVGLSSNILGMIMAQARIFLAMASDGLMPSWLARIHPRVGTPRAATLATGAGCATLAGLVPIDVLAELTSMGTLLSFLLVSLGVMVLRRRQPERARRFRVPGGPYLIPLASSTVCLLLMGAASGSTLWRVALWMVVGVAYYGWRTRGVPAAAAEGWGA